MSEKDARKYVVAFDSLCERVDRCTCGAGPGGYHGAHEHGCGLEFIASLEQIFDALSAQPPPEVPAGAEVAEVLAGLVEMRKIEASYRVLSNDGHEDMDGLAEAWAAAADMVEQKAATGARAAGGINTRLPGVVSVRTAAQCSCTPHPYGEGPEVDCEVHGLDAETMRWLKASGLCSVGDHDELSEWLANKPAAPPAPSAPGVAELLALCEQRQKSAFVAVVSCDEIVRLLAPDGADGTEAGT